MARLRVGLVRAVVAASGLFLAACGEPASETAPAPSGSGPTLRADADAYSTYEQSFVFANIRGDSVFLVPWLLRTVARPDSVYREAHGWLARSGAWDAFFSEAWTTPPTRTPSRLIPYGSLKLLVQEGDVVDGIIFEEGTRRLELALGDVRASWGGPRGEAVELLDGGAYLSDERIEGFILHIARASSGDAAPGGDWALLVSGDSLTLVVAADEEHGGDSEPVYRGWARLGEEERQWTSLRVDWLETQAFPPARRDVPLSWSIVSADRPLSAALNVASADIRPGTGPGPLLPVRALYVVEGQVTLPEGIFPVRGLLVHERR